MRPALATGFVLILTQAYAGGVSERCRCFGAGDAADGSTLLSLLRASGLALAGVGLTIAAARGSAAADVGIPLPTLVTATLTAGVYVAAFAMLGSVRNLWAMRKALARRAAGSIERSAA
jgi:hypothetical protein